jgi:hypothetical protein
LVSCCPDHSRLSAARTLPSKSITVEMAIVDDVPSAERRAANT